MKHFHMYAHVDGCIVLFMYCVTYVNAKYSPGGEILSTGDENLSKAGGYIGFIL